MRLTSTRDKTVNSSYANAILNCLPTDGGLYVPDGNANLRRWILYTNELTSFSSIAGALTSAFINNEYSPIICEAIATKAFPFEPELKQLDTKLFALELFHGPTGCYRDFGVSYLVSLLETTLHMENKNAVLLDFTTGEHGAILSNVLKDKKHLKSVLVYPKGKLRGLSEQDFIWNGGNIYPVEFDGNEKEVREIIKSIFKNTNLVNELNLTISTTANIGRLIPQTFFFAYAFSRLKNKISGDIFYALDPENYGNLIAGLYSWRLALPVTGFILPTTEQLTIDEKGNPIITGSQIPFNQRTSANVSDPSNLERLEDFFSHYAPMMKTFIHASNISEDETDQAAKILLQKYNRLTDYNTAKAYAAALKNENLLDEDDGAIVLLDRFHPAYSKEYIKNTLDRTVDIPSSVESTTKPFTLDKTPISTQEELIKILKSIN